MRRRELGRAEGISGMHEVVSMDLWRSDELWDFRLLGAGGGWRVGSGIMGGGECHD